MYNLGVLLSNGNIFKILFSSFRKPFGALVSFVKKHPWVSLFLGIFTELFLQYYGSAILGFLHNLYTNYPLVHLMCRASSYVILLYFLVVCFRFVVFIIRPCILSPKFVKSEKLSGTASNMHGKTWTIHALNKSSILDVLPVDFYNKLKNSKSRLNNSGIRISIEGVTCNIKRRYLECVSVFYDSTLDEFFAAIPSVSITCGRILPNNDSLLLISNSSCSDFIVFLPMLKYRFDSSFFSTCVDLKACFHNDASFSLVSMLYSDSV